MNKEFKIKIYLKDLKKPLELIVSNKNMIDNLINLIFNEERYVKFGNIIFSKEKFIFLSYE